eukprot:m.92763 g.92763  ORF g.92763 m.92763 type:complete len:75 (+) comp15074_c0_seq2:273-497(+)
MPRSFPQIAARVVPVSFALGAFMEWFMLNVQIGHETFYDTAVRLEAKRRFEQQQEEQQKASNDPSSDSPPPAAS